MWQKQQETEHQRQLEYWTQQLDGSQPAEVLCDKPRPVVLSGTAKRHEVTIEVPLYTQLQLFYKTHQATPFTVLLAAFRAAHYRLTAVEEATIGTPSANRNREELEDLVGFFINLQCIRITVGDGESFESLVRQVVGTTAAASAHQDVPFERIVAAVRQGPRDLSRNPLVQTVFAVHSQENSHLKLEGVETEPVGDAETSRFDLEFHLFQKDDRIRGFIMFSDELFDSVSIQGLVSLFYEILRRGLTEPSMPIAAMPLTDNLIGTKDIAHVARTNYPRNSSVPALFRRQAAISPDALAAKDDTGHLTYAELDRKSDQVARWLGQRGFAAETLVCVLAPRSCEAIVAFLGILKSSLAYLPLDINTPLGRLETILSTISGNKLVLLGTHTAAPATQLEEVTFETIATTIQDAPRQSDAIAPPALSAPSPTSLAYIMFTSGSTGRPKGVMVEHRGIVRLVKNTNIATKEQTSVPIAHIANLSFDAATWEIYAALLNGGSLICIDHMDVLDPVYLGDKFLRDGMRAVYCAPSLLKNLLPEKPSAISQLKLLVVGGEIFRPQDALDAQRLVSGSVYNCYGNTENTGFTTIYRIQHDDKNVHGVPIGRTISNSGALVMDSQQRLVPSGVMGELILIGDGIARGYTDPALNRDRFVQVLVDGEQVRAYRTGDRARYRPTDGQLEFFGRMDYQVKIRGYRIELTEVEQVLLQDDEFVEDAVVLVREIEGEGLEMVSFVALKPQHANGVHVNGAYENGLVNGGHVNGGEQTQSPTISQEQQQKAEAYIRAALQAKLPSYMIPARITIIDKMPLNPNGKVDRRALAPTAAQGPRTIVAPRNSTELAVCEEFSHVLGVEVGIADSFFDLGGLSLMATRLVSRIKSRLGWEVILRDLYQHSTPKALCNEVISRAHTGLSLEQSGSFVEVHPRENSRATLVLIHGFWGSATIFSHLVPLVDNTMDVIVLHDPFFGSPEGPLTVQDWANFYLKALKAHLPLDRHVVLGGYSSGGLIALQMASAWNIWWSTDLASVILLDPGTFEYGDVNKVDSAAIDREIEYSLRLFGHEQKSNIIQHLKKLEPLTRSMTEPPEYLGNGLYISTGETVEAGVSQWWSIHYPYLQTNHVSTSHHALLEETLVGELSQLINQHCLRRLEQPRERANLEIATRGATKTIDVGRQSQEAVSEQIRQTLLEVSNGGSAAKLIFKGTNGSGSELTRACAELGLATAMQGPYRWAVRCSWVHDNDPVLVILSSRRWHSYKSSHSGLISALAGLKDPEPTSTTLYRLAYELDNRSLWNAAPALADDAVRKLLAVAQCDSLLCSSLAAEILTHQGIPTLPTQAVVKSQQKAGGDVSVDMENKHAAATFEKRINVDNYNFFELVHPGYFRQTVALASLVARFVKKPCPTAIDVGPGPGTNLLAFQEMLPHTNILAVEPSDVAFYYLQDHFNGNAKVQILHEDFLNVPVDCENVDYIMSTGASHHFNTDAFLQRSMTWLRPGGYWFIADEMISAFETQSQRRLNLLRHHLAYMVPLCLVWEAVDSHVLAHAERAFIDDYNRSVPHAKFFADNGDLEAAESIYRALLRRTEKHGFTTKVSDPKLAFWRLQWLELEALVAGLDIQNLYHYQAHRVQPQNTEEIDAIPLRRMRPAYIRSQV